MLPAALAEKADAVSLAFGPIASQAAGAARDLVDRYGDNIDGAPTQEALDALRHRLRLTQYKWDKVTPADRLHVAWLLWDGIAPAAEHDDFLRDYLIWLDAPNRRYQAVRLAFAWAAAFDATLPSIAIVGDWLAARAATMPEPWPLLASEFEIFSYTNSPTMLAETFLTTDESPTDFFARIKLPARVTSGGLILEMLSVATAATTHWAAQDPRLALRLCELALDGETFRPDAIATTSPDRAAMLRETLAEALLLPWEDRDPPASVKDRIIAFLLRHYGDLRMTPRPWNGVHAAAVKVMRHWLVEHTVTTYFRLAAKSKTVDRARLHERLEFWRAQLGEIDGAWLISGTQGAAALSHGPLAFGRLGGCRPDQAALLLRVGALTILESSHETNEAIWLPENPFAPPLYRDANEVYWPRMLANNPDYSSAYSSAGSYNWQERLMRFLAQA